MAAAKGNHQTERPSSQQQDESQSPTQPRPFWSGIIAFGLVSLPVSLFPANRGKAISLKMVDSEGHPLSRRYFCDKENRSLEKDEIVRGYPVDKDKFVIVEDEELEALSPEKTREIDLRRFVPQEEVNPVYFERGYFLAPDSASTKAYRLLARSMEEEKRVGIATFVMRDKEYIIAIMSERGILRAETLRFHDEIRTPSQVGLPQLDKADQKLTRAFKQAIKKLSAKTLDPSLLADHQANKLLAMVEEKLASETDIIEAPDELEAPENNVIDLIQVLKERLKGKQVQQAQTRAKETNSELSRDELYEKARENQIQGRSKMTKDELLTALKDTG